MHAASALDRGSGCRFELRRRERGMGRVACAARVLARDPSIGRGVMGWRHASVALAFPGIVSWDTVPPFSYISFSTFSTKRKGPPASNRRCPLGWHIS